MNRRIALTGGIACGKSLVAKFLNAHGVATIDADDVVHGLIPAEERKRLAKVVFNDPKARADLEAKIHPLVKGRIEKWLEDFRLETEDEGVSCLPSKVLCIAIIPLLFEAHWEENFDIICCVRSDRTTQVARMTETRGYTREEAEARLAAQLPVEEKAAKSHYVINNNGSVEELKREVEKFILWLKNSTCSQER